ncbi:MAG: MFS transporter [Ignisphaera sp.]
MSYDLNNRRDNAIKKLYLRISALSFSNNLVSPILPYLIVYYGGGATESGIFQASNNLLGNIGQVMWGRISDSTGRRRLMLLLGALSTVIISIASLVLIGVFGSANPYEIIAISAIATFIGSASAPVIGDVISDLAGQSRRSIVYSMHSNLSAVFSIAGNIATTIMFQCMPSTFLALLVIFFSALVLGFVSVFATLSISGVVIDRNINSDSSVLHKRAGLGIEEFVKSFKITLSNPGFKGFVYANTLYNFSMSLAWPLFILSQQDVLNLSPAQITSLSIASNITMVLSQYLAGKYVERSRYRFYTLLNRFGLVIVPLVYAFSASYVSLLALNIFTGFINGFTNIIFPMYIIECAREGDRATFFGVYNTAIGLASFAGSMLGGLLSGYLIDIFGLVQGLRISYMISAVMRLSSAIVTARMKEYIY